MEDKGKRIEGSGKERTRKKGKKWREVVESENLRGRGVSFDTGVAKFDPASPSS